MSLVSTSADVAADNYGHRLHFWDWRTHELTQSIDLGRMA